MTSLRPLSLQVAASSHSLGDIPTPYCSRHLFSVLLQASPLAAPQHGSALNTSLPLQLPVSCFYLDSFPWRFLSSLLATSLIATSCGSATSLYSSMKPLQIAPLISSSSL
ncbi:hypothetical protein GOP47_0021112 [Adiantum capillus-veneris]|uniref:Uncharacterized protein n=1 Tax=Adiantum capillus-veneris TaxID=13818 RepID=A0A9D4UAV8_ADICA|nr:hypothetical protein GOP47_0021112 [Adiantum capillus-veneris]